jgi:hypothetical protein
LSIGRVRVRIVVDVHSAFDVSGFLPLSRVLTTTATAIDHLL